MRSPNPFSWRQLGNLASRSLFVGALSGLVGGGLLFFVFGFIGFAGAPFSSRVANGWSALLDPGLGKGLAVGAGIAFGLIALMAVYIVLARRFDPGPARPWLATLAGVLVVLFNLEWLRTSAGWDWAGIVTVAAIALLVWTVVWLVAPWVLRDWPVEVEANH